MNRDSVLCVSSEATGFLDTCAMIWAALKRKVLLHSEGDVSVPESETEQAGFGAMAKAVFTDAHFLIPVVVLIVGIALLIALH